MRPSAIIHVATRRFDKRTRAPVRALLLTLLWSLPVGAQEGEKAETPLGLEYAVSIETTIGCLHSGRSRAFIELALTPSPTSGSMSSGASKPSLG